jgi:hypothetical protein
VSPGSPASSGAPLQWPLLGVVVLLVLLILLTPGLLGLGQPSAGSPATQAVLIVDRAPGTNETHFYLQGVATLRYARLDLGLAIPPSWPVVSAAGLHWDDWVNQTDSLSVSVASAQAPVAVNVTAEFVDANGAVGYFLGAYAFEVLGPTIYLASLTPGLDPGTSSLPLTDLPQSLPLLASATGAGP